MKYWLLIVFAGFFECFWAVGLKYTEGFSKLMPSIWTIGCMMVSFYLMSLALQRLPMGTAYAVWTGIGSVGVALFGMIFLGESKDLIRIGCIMLIVIGILGLKLFSIETH